MIESVLAITIVSCAIAGAGSVISDLAVWWGLQRWASRNQMVLLRWNIGRIPSSFGTDPPPCRSNAGRPSRTGLKAEYGMPDSAAPRTRCAIPPWPAGSRFAGMTSDPPSANRGRRGRSRSILPSARARGRRLSLGRAGLALAIAALLLWAFAPGVINRTFSAALLAGGALAFVCDGAYRLLASFLRRFPERLLRFSSSSGSGDGASGSRGQPSNRTMIDL